MSWVGLDIGGANLKAADGLGWARSQPFAMFQQADDLASELTKLLAAAPASGRLAITMTGELSDRFRTKAEGVRFILAAAERAAAGREVCVYLVDGRFVPVETAAEFPQLAAASNWHALAQFARRLMQSRSGLVVDIGSTTTDIIPVHDGSLSNLGKNDTDRLLAGELVYTGVIHTPICAATQSLPWRGQSCPVASELFAATADAYVLLGDIGEDCNADWTADGRPLTRVCSRGRLARMLCADAAIFDDADAERAAAFIRDAQMAKLRDASAMVAARIGVVPEIAVIGGVGEFLARRLVADLWPTCEIVSLTERLGSAVSACAPAHALAVMARETVTK